MSLYSNYESPWSLILLEACNGITQAKQKIARTTGIPMTKQGLERKIGNAILKGAKKLIK